ncbi:adenosine deaminase 2-like [Musca vetustissima]|uniref:adenosine deaminase 2-like n=2 Tax=Musca vetustissima TaxID=27455 RepID=UPI002AB7A3DE|nr:adenosine deaminase 2-like [Musca vetustissima]
MIKFQIWLLTTIAICTSAKAATTDTSVLKQKQYYLPYQDAREAVIQAEDLLSTGGRLHLNSRESKVDEIFLKYKYDELARGFHDSDRNPAAMHFFKAKPLIERSKVFHFLQQMPKGALLHTHTSATVSSKWVVANIFRMPGLLRCVKKDGVSILSFRRMPEKHNCATQYVSVNEERSRSASASEYDRALEKLINLYTPTPELEYSSINRVWSKFQNMFSTISDALLYIPAFRTYHWQMMEEMYNDNIMYAEVRMNFYELYDISGRIFPAERCITELIDIIRKFKLQHPDFLGIKIIVSPHRNAEPDVMRKRYDIFKKYHSMYPKELIGFDLVGQEDKGKPLHNFVSVLHDLPKSAKFFFHAGETNWFGASTDYNLLDAILLNTTRIGHGFALMKHPVLWNAVKSRDIAVEVSPISNQILNLVWDLRNHPGALFLAQNIPMVICNDDPGFWDAKGLSYDFYYAIMSLAPNNAGLKTLKQLVWNSLKYSTFEAGERQRAYALLQKKWDHFIDDVLSGLVV